MLLHSYGQIFLKIILNVTAYLANVLLLLLYYILTRRLYTVKWSGFSYIFNNYVVKEKYTESTYYNSIDCFEIFLHKYKHYLPNKTPPTINFLMWLVGFTEGKGKNCFVVNKRGDLVFSITELRTNITILHYIKEILGFGKIVEQSFYVNKYVTQNKKEIDIIISLFNGITVLPSNNIILRNYIEAFNIWANKGDIRITCIKPIDNSINPRLDNNWLAGFNDTKGQFICSLDNKGYSIKYAVTANKIDLIILTKLMALFGNGVICEKTKNRYEYSISGFKAYHIVSWYFETYMLLSNNKLCYELFKGISCDLELRNQDNPEGRKLINEKIIMINAIYKTIHRE